MSIGIGAGIGIAFPEKSGSITPPLPGSFILLENGVNFILLETSATDKIELE